MSEEYRTKEYWEKRTIEYRDNRKAMLFRDPRFDEYEKRTIVQLEQWKNLEVADICCGYGRFAKLFTPLKYMGFDFSEEMLKIAREENPDCWFPPAFNVKSQPHLQGYKRDVVFEVNSLHCLGMTPEQFFEKYKQVAKIAVACLEADRFTIFQIYG